MPQIVDVLDEILADEIVDTAASPESSARPSEASPGGTPPRSRLDANQKRDCSN